MPVRIVAFDDVEARLWTISENLHRNELTVTQRAEQIAEWIRLTEGKREEVSVQVGPKTPRAVAARERRERRSPRARHHPDEGQRAVKIDAIVPAAKDAMRAG